ncbi:ParB/RepB/Spo0J family partition protein [Weissella viridescens]|uniref:ParB/RepB/Spo0J family partition protein n=1 Tax=Weissella viridescens TaxID=1629 RepID=UPI001745E73C|nr:ParB/RepB/Spo0J family partition protein [Weissella viridescens]QOD86266.1 ParB/RepB/Spo0J family partition protein [Weissella viridescens]WJI91393.1 ParB/RepB/Spo0J family partition protein [Weissella viridescens]
MTNLLEDIAANKLKKTGATMKLSIENEINSHYDVISIPLNRLYYNDQNGRINTSYKQFQNRPEIEVPEVGSEEYNRIFEDLIYNSNKEKMNETIRSISEKSQQEPGVVLSDGRVIDGNRRFTALRKIQEGEQVEQTFDAIVLRLDTDVDKKRIKELELDLQLGRESKVDYDPIDRIYDVYKTIELDKLMTAEEYKRNSGQKSTKKINRDLRLADLIIRFIGIVSPGGNPADKFYLARDLKLDGPIEDIEGTLTKMKSAEKESVVEAVLVNLALAKMNDDDKDSTRVIRNLKDNVLKDSDRLGYYLDAVDDNVDFIIDSFEDAPIETANDLRLMYEENSDFKRVADKINDSTQRLIDKGQRDSKRRSALFVLDNLFESLSELSLDDFKDLTDDEYIEAKDILVEIRQVSYKLKEELDR